MRISIRLREVHIREFIVEALLYDEVEIVVMPQSLSAFSMKCVATVWRMHHRWG